LDGVKIKEENVKKVALLCVVALCLAACHCERKTTGTPCRKAACKKCMSGKMHSSCKCNKVHMGPLQQACSCDTVCAHAKPAHKHMKRVQPAAKTAEAKAAEQTAALSTIGNVNRQGNTLSLSYKEPIRFGHNSATIENASYKELDATANVLKKYPNTQITVKGYTDSLGDPTYNVDLSQRRAQAVADALVARGVNAQNVKAVGYGAANPIATNSTAAGRAQNRRVELELETK